MTAILAIHAHPDDIELLAAGTLALLASAGHQITLATVTAGDCGSADSDREEIARVRRLEASKSAALIGAPYLCAELPDLAVFSDDPSRRRITELIRQARPELVLTASPADYHPDHEATSLLVRDACFAATATNYHTGDAQPLRAIPHLFFMDPVGGRDREGRPIVPEFGVDVGATFETKCAMLEAHESQKAWMLKQHGISDFLASMVAWSQRRGADYGVQVAEGFRQYRTTPYPCSPLLQELVGEALRSVS